MTVQELYNRLGEIIQEDKYNGDARCVIHAHVPRMTGDISTVPVLNANMGMDWHAGEFIIEPTRELTIR